MEKLLEILKQIDAEIDFENEKELIDSGALESLAIVRIITAIEDNYDVIIDPDDIDPENFQSAEDIFDMIGRITKGGSGSRPRWRKRQRHASPRKRGWERAGKPSRGLWIFWRKRCPTRRPIGCAPGI